jgi:DNA-binding transcriptional regulator YiaG
MEWKKMDVMQFRISLGMNQKQFAEWLGVRQATISEWESGTKSPSPMACRLMDLLKERHEADVVTAKPKRSRK